MRWLIATLATLLAAAAPAHAAEGPRVHVPTAPSAVPAADGARHLVYELVIENRAARPARLEQLVVRDPRRGPVLALRGRALARRVARLDGQTGARSLPARTIALAMLDVSVPDGRPVPARLVTRLTVSVAAGGRRARRVSTAATRVLRRAPVTVGPPLRRANLAVLGCCDLPFAHRLAFSERADEPVFAQRYAIDFLGLDDQVNTFSGDPTRNESYFIFGAEVIAAAPGRIVATRNDAPENTPPGLPSAITPNDAVGNFVNQDLGGGRFALYAHLQPGSVRVQPGDQVQRGQVLGLVGNTGNSSEPHLHFHVMDAQGGASNLDADGLPFVFDAFRLDARLAGLAAEPPALTRVPVAPPLALSERYPLTGDVVAFP